MPRCGGVKWAQGLGSCKLFAMAGIPGVKECWQKKLRSLEQGQDMPGTLNFIL